MKIYTALLLSFTLSICAAGTDIEEGRCHSPFESFSPSNSVVIEMATPPVRTENAANEGILESGIAGAAEGMRTAMSYKSGEESDVDEPNMMERVTRRPHRTAHRSRRLRSVPVLSSVAGSSPALEVPHFNVSDYYDQEEYLTQKIQEMIVNEARYDERAKIYNVLGTGSMWVAGVSGFATTIVSILGGSSIIPPVASAVTTGCLGAFTTFCVWSSAQFKKSGSQYHQASTAIQVKLGVPSKLITHPVDIRIDPLRNTGIVDAPQPTPVTSLARGLRNTV